MNTAQCKGCGAAIKFIRMKSGKMMPVNPEPYMADQSRTGKEIFVRPDGELIKGKSICKLDPGTKHAGYDHYIPHWASCPAAKQFKKQEKDRFEQATIF